jgi:hypothetical protein
MERKDCIFFLGKIRNFIHPKGSKITFYRCMMHSPKPWVKEKKKRNMKGPKTNY